MAKDIRKKILLAGIFLLCVTATGTIGYYLLGHLSGDAQPWKLADCFYMTVITLTTVGFGEVIDLTHVPGGRLFTVFILPGGLGVAMYFVSQMIRPRVVRYLDLMMRDRHCVVRIEDVTLSENSPLVGKQVYDINFPDFPRLLVLAVIRNSDSTPVYNPDRSMLLEAGDTLVLQADLDSLKRFRRKHT